MCSLKNAVTKKYMKPSSAKMENIRDMLERQQHQQQRIAGNNNGQNKSKITPS